MSHHSNHCPELPAKPSRIALFAGMALAAGAALSWWVERPRGPECAGYLAVRSTFIKAHTESTVDSLTIKEGAPVRIGDVLLVLRDDLLHRQLEEKRNRISVLQSELSRAEAEAELELKWRIQGLEAEICEIQLKSASYLKEKYDFELQRTMLTETLAQKSTVPPGTQSASLEEVSLTQDISTPDRLQTVAQLEAAANAAEVSAAQVEICGERETSLVALKAELPQKIQQKVGVDVARGQLSSAEAELKQLEAQTSGMTVSSPAIGLVGVFKVQPGDRLKPGDDIVELLDSSKRYLVVHVPSQSTPEFQVGTPVTLTFPGNVTRAGEVTRVAPQTESLKSGEFDNVVLVQVEQRGAVWPEVPIGALVKARPSTK
ncbi:HlyD family secretion protein [Planctomicrobium sp. SH668]|uniref:HlyD family secretion protein n=1 Tax=Planctomicrobium sp. SH668 TaxID=3448126 RepID=UPI003F5B448C